LSSVFSYIREFYKKEFNFYYFLLILLLVGTCIYLNYWHSLEARYVAGGSTQWGHFGGYYFLYFIPFAAGFFLQPLFFKDCDYFRNPWFWIILLLAPAFFSFRVNFDLHQPLIKKLWSGDEQEFWLRSLNWVVRVFVVLIPVFVLWLVKDRTDQPFYGTGALKQVRPYLAMLLIMVPLIALASTQNDFLQMYPKAKVIDQLDLSSKKWYYLVYELCYGFDFISIEFFFRGFLILSLAKICGPRCIIPVACFYCTIHFGKPMGEAISSFFGGVILGIVSYNTRSIWGGLIVHLGIAWLMETGSWLALLLKGN
jgi:membrane protease YdiL (CAAX protease family)